MKKSIQSLFALSILFFSVSIQNATAQEGKTKMDAWPEMKAFHEIMAKTFHPAEKGDLVPIKKLSSDLAKKAVLWAESAPPKELGEIDVKANLKKLMDNCASLDKMIKGGADDKAILKSLNNLHNQFHEIVGVCLKDHEEKPTSVEVENPDNVKKD